MKTYTARAEREGRWWLITVEGVPGAVTQARRFEDVEATVRDLLSLILEVPESNFEVRVLNSW